MGFIVFLKFYLRSCLFGQDPNKGSYPCFPCPLQHRRQISFYHAKIRNPLAFSSKKRGVYSFMRRQAQFMPQAIHDTKCQFMQPQGCNSLRVSCGEYANIPISRNRGDLDEKFSLAPRRRIDIRREEANGNSKQKNRNQFRVAIEDIYAKQYP